MRFIKRGAGFTPRRMMGVSLCVLVIVATVNFASKGAQTAGAERPRDSHATPAGEVVVVFNEQFFNALLDAMLSLSKPPTYPLSLRRSKQQGRVASETGAGSRRDAASAHASSCASEITLAREIDGTRTAVHFTGGRIIAPVAFRGSYDAALLGCIKFQGWADTNINLTFDGERQVLTARIAVEEVHVNGLPALVGNGITDLVQRAIDARVNPVEVLRSAQLAARIPVAQSNETLGLRAREVHSEIAQNELRLHIFYDIVRMD